MNKEIKSSFNLENAIQLATVAHKGQVDKSGRDYILHPLRVMNRLLGESFQMAAILHDVIEDTDITIEDLKKLGINTNIIDAIILLTHPTDYKGTREEYFDNIRKIAESGNQIAIDVKYSDLIDNSDITRIEKPTERDLDRVKKYQKAMEILKPLVSSYLSEVR